MREILEALELKTPEGVATAIGAADKSLEAAAAIRAAYEPYWALSRAFYVGHQTLEVAGRNRNQLRPMPKKRRPEIVSNQILPRVRALVAGLTASRPKAQVVTADEDDPRAREASKLGDEILTAILEYVKFGAVMRSAVLDAVLFGKGFVVSGWDRAAGVTVQVQKCAECGEAAREGIKACACEADVSVVEVETGDFFSRSVSPFQVLADETATTLRDAEWVHVEWHMSKARAESTFGGEFTEETIDTRSFYSPEERVAPPRKAVRIKQTWWKKSNYAPRGLTMMWHKDRVLQWRQECSPDGELPVSEIVVDEVPDQFWASGIAEPLIPLQNIVNETMQRLLEMADLAADPRYLAEQGTMTPSTENSPSGGKVRQYKKSAGRAPTLETPPQVSPVFSEILRLAVSQMDFIAQQYAPFRGEPGDGVTSGYQTRVLIERTATSLSAISTTIEEATARQGKLEIMAAQAHMSEQRTLSFAGEYGAPKVKAFRGADLAGIQDVKCVHGSASPESREARREFMLAMAKVVTAAPEMQRAVLEAIETGVKLPPDPMKVVRDQVADENERLLAGDDVIVHQLQFHDSHIQGHYLDAASERWTTKPPEEQARLLQHIQEHEVAQIMEEARRAALLRDARAKYGIAEEATAGGAMRDGAAAPVARPTAATPELQAGGM